MNWQREQKNQGIELEERAKESDRRAVESDKRAEEIYLSHCFHPRCRIVVYRQVQIQVGGPGVLFCGL